VDTEGSFSTERFIQIHSGEREEIKRDFQNVLLLSPTSFSEQRKAFSDLLKWVKNETISLIIVDSIVMFYRLELGDAIKSKEEQKIREVNSELAGQLRSLNEIARKQKIPVIVTNQVYSSFVKNEEKKQTIKEISMVGGDLLKYWSKCLIELQVVGGRRKMILQKHRSLPNKEMLFEIINKGIRRKGLF